jgi:hypothetical protein
MSARVKTSKAQNEQMFSGLPPKADFDLRVNEYTEAACASTSARRAAVKREHYAP